jgi:hypothetical protein
MASGNKMPITTIETETTTIEVVATEALIEDDRQQMMTMEEEEARMQQEQEELDEESNIIITEALIQGAPDGVKVEQMDAVEEDDEEGTTTYASVLDAAADMDADSIMEALGEKILQRFSIWDLMLRKAQLQFQDGAVPVLVEETERILLEMKILLESTMYHIPQKFGRKKKNLDANEFIVSDLVGTALCIDSGLWRRKDIEDIDYDSPLELNRLLSSEKRGGVVSYASGLSMAAASAATSSTVGFVSLSSTGTANTISSARQSLTSSSSAPRKRIKVEEEEDLDDGAREPHSDDPDYKGDQKPRRGSRKTVPTAKALQLKTGGKRKRGRPPKSEEAKTKLGNEENIPGGGDEEVKPAKVKKARLKYQLDDKRFICKYPDCTKSDVAFKNRTEFEQHFLNDHAKEEHRIIDCLVDGCEEMFALTSERNAHMDEKHER